MFGEDSCGDDTGSGELLRCWNGLSTAADVVAESTSANQPSGATTTLHFKVGIDSGAAAVTEGVYTATTTLTAIPL